MIEVNRAVAVAFASGTGAGLELLRPCSATLRWRTTSRCTLHAARAELLRRAGDSTGATRAYRRAIELSANAVERAELERRLESLGSPARRARDGRPRPAADRPA